MEKLKYGIIGMGNIVGKHLGGYSAYGSDVEMVACCDLREDRMNEVANKYHIPNRFTNYKDLLAFKGLDFISVCLPNYLHSIVTVEALEAGLNVHCEKPIAISSSEAQRMVDAKNKSGKKLMIGLNNRFTSQSQYTKAMIDSGELGDIYLVKSGWLRRTGIAPSGWFTDKEKSGGGPLIDLGVHFIDLALYFMGYPDVQSVLAKTFCKFGTTVNRPAYTFPGCKVIDGAKYDVEDLAIGFVDLKNNAGLQFEVSWASNIEKEKNYYEIYGTKAGIKMVNDCDGHVDFKMFTVVGGQQVDIVPHINPNLTTITEFGHFISCIRNNEEPTVVKPEECVKIMKLIEGIYRSSEEHKPIIF